MWPVVLSSFTGGFVVGIIAALVAIARDKTVFRLRSGERIISSKHLEVIFKLLGKKQKLILEKVLNGVPVEQAVESVNMGEEDEVE